MLPIFERKVAVPEPPVTLNFTVWLVDGVYIKCAIGLSNSLAFLFKGIAVPVLCEFDTKVTFVLASTQSYVKYPFVISEKLTNDGSPKNSYVFPAVKVAIPFEVL